MDLDTIKRLIASLEREGVRYAIFGAVAMGLHGLARFTEDIDIFIQPTADNIARLRSALHAVVDDPDIDQITDDDLLGEYPIVQYVPPGGAFHIDIVTRIGDAHRFEDLPTERLTLDDVEVSVVTARGLYAMKRATVRPKDRADAEALRQRFGFWKDEER